MSADAVDFRFDVLHGKLAFRHQVHFVLNNVKKQMFLTEIGPRWSMERK